MLNVQKLIPRGAGLAAALLKRAATVELDWDVRQKSRFEGTDSPSPMKAVPANRWPCRRAATAPRRRGATSEARAT